MIPTDVERYGCKIKYEQTTIPYTWTYVMAGVRSVQGVVLVLQTLELVSRRFME